MNIHPAMIRRAQPEADAVWVGELDLARYSALPDGESLVLEEAEGYFKAKLLLRDGSKVLRFEAFSLENGSLPAGARALLLSGYETLAEAELTEFPLFTVAISTRERPEDLCQALATIEKLDYPNFEVLVVDNAPETDATRKVLEERYPQVKYVLEPRKGISSARNTAILNATGQYIAFTDDDVAVDSQWLRALLRSFNQSPDISCVSGLVPSGELATKSQRYFDSRVTWSRNIEARTYRLSERYADLPAFPFSVGAYGTGANFAIRRDGAQLFDPALGTGRMTGGGEDIDYFFRLLLAGNALVVNPDAFVWHRHRANEEALMKQALTYGSGLGAWLTKVALTPRAWGLLPSRVAAGLYTARHLGGDPAAQGEVVALDPQLNEQIRAAEKRAIFKGPLLYLRERRRALSA